MMKYGIFKGLLFCGCMLQAFGGGNVFGTEIGKQNIEAIYQGTDATRSKITIDSMVQLYQLTKEQANELDSVVFKDLEITEDFVRRFWILFSYGADEVEFVNCNCDIFARYRFADLFDHAFRARELKFSNSNLTLSDLRGIFKNLYSYCIDEMVFEDIPLDKDAIERVYSEEGMGADGGKLTVR